MRVVQSLPESLRSRLRRAHVHTLRRLQPVDHHFGFGRGRPIDRLYIEDFLTQRSADIHGRVLEIADPSYTYRFGGARVTQADVLHAVEGNPEATIVGDLATGEGLQDGVYDAIVLTQTLQVIYDVSAAIAHVHRALKPGGVVLATMHGIAQLSRPDWESWGEYWRFTDLSAHRLFAEPFGNEQVEVRTYGNVLAATALLYGLAIEDVGEEALRHHDDLYQVMIAVRARKRE